MPSYGIDGERGRMKQRRMTIAAIACGVVCATCVAAFLWSVQGEASAARAEVLAQIKRMIKEHFEREEEERKKTLRQTMEIELIR